MRNFPAGAVRLGFPHRSSKLVLEDRFVPGRIRSRDLAPADGETLLSRVVLEIEINGRGKAVSCREVERDGPVKAPSGACETAVPGFDVPPDLEGKGAPLSGTYIMSAFARTVR